MSSSKKILRRKYKHILQNINPSNSLHISNKLLPHIPSENSLILSFAKLDSQNEIDLSILNIHLAKNQRLALPRVNTSSHLLDLFIVSDIDSIILSDYGIPEPDPNICTPVKPEDIDIVLVPGLAFDHQMNRLGRGKGFYDKLLTQIKGTKIGVCFQEQISNDILPTDPWDQKVDILIFN